MISNDFKWFQMISNVHQVKPFDPMKNLSYISYHQFLAIWKKHPAKVHVLGMVCNTCFTKMAIIYIAMIWGELGATPPFLPIFLVKVGTSILELPKMSPAAVKNTEDTTGVKTSARGHASNIILNLINKNMIKKTSPSSILPHLQPPLPNPNPNP